jgi:hypothetical protein
MAVTALAERQAQPALDSKIATAVLLHGDVEKLSDEQRISYVKHVCDTLGLNFITQPFAFIRLNGKLVLYAKKDATEQLRKLHGVSVSEITSQRLEDVFVVTAKAQDRTGRTDAATGAVAIGNLKGEALANALMKAETKAKRRVTLSICGLGMLDELEAEPLAEPLPVVVEAPRRVALPAGTVQIIKAESKSVRGVSWSEVTMVDTDGTEHVLPTPADGTGAAVSLFEQLADEACPVVITTKVTPRSKKTVIDQVMRWTPDAVNNVPIDAEEVIDPRTDDQVPF